MKYLSVCAGIEAASVAWENFGWEAVGFSEIEKFPSEVLKHHYPTVTNFGDMTKYKEWNLESIDILVGGTPCQSFSVAGLRKGLEDPRGNLMLTYCGLLDKFRPKWFIWENVPGVLSSNGGRDFGSFLGAVAELGYGFAYRVLDAQYFGVAQRRRRVFVVGCLGNWRPAAKVLFESESLSGNIKKGRKSEQEVAATITARFGNSRNNHEELAPVCPATTASTLNASFGDKLGLENQHINSGTPLFVPAYVSEVSSTLTASGAGFSRPGQTSTAHENYVAYCLQGAGATSQNANGSGWNKEKSFTLNVTDVHGVATGFNTNARPDEMNFLDEQSNTLTASQNSGVAIGSSEISGTLRANRGSGWRSNGTPVEAVAIQNMAVRRLTEIECERLQGFPDNYTNIKENCPSGARYKALGNSMAVPVMRWIGERINLING